MSKKSLTQSKLVSIIEYLTGYIDLTTKFKRVWKYLKKLHKIQGHVFPCYKTIARECGCCIDTACRAVKKFQASNWLVRIRRPYCSNRYVLNPIFEPIEVGPQDRVALKNLSKYEKEYFEKYPPSPPDPEIDVFREENIRKTEVNQNVSLSSVSLNYNRIDSTTKNAVILTNAALHPLVISGKYTNHDLRCWGKQPEYVINQALIKHEYIQNKVKTNNQLIRNEAALMNSLIYKEAQKYKDSKSPPASEPEAKQQALETPTEQETNVNYISSKNKDIVELHITNKPISEIQMGPGKVHIVVSKNNVEIVTVLRGHICCYRTVLLEEESSRFKKTFDNTLADVIKETEAKDNEYKNEQIQKEKTRIAIAQRKEQRMQARL